MLKFRAFFVAVALAAVSPAFAQGLPIASAGQLPPSLSAGQGQPPASAGQAPAAPAPQAPQPAGQTVCGLPVPIPSQLPPAGSAPVVYLVVPCFMKQGGYSVIEAQTYLYYLQATQHLSSPANNRWVPYDDKIEQVIVADFKRLWATSFLDDLSVDVQD